MHRTYADPSSILWKQWHVDAQALISMVNRSSFNRPVSPDRGRRCDCSPSGELPHEVTRHRRGVSATTTGFLERKLVAVKSQGDWSVSLQLLRVRGACGKLKEVKVFYVFQ